MTKLLEHAVAKVRALPDEEQDELALALLVMADHATEIVELDEETRAAIQEGLEQARQGEFVSDDEMAALWKRYGL